MGQATIFLNENHASRFSHRLSNHLYNVCVDISKDTLLNFKTLDNKGNIKVTFRDNNSPDSLCLWYINDFMACHCKGVLYEVLTENQQSKK